MSARHAQLGCLLTAGGVFFAMAPPATAQDISVAFGQGTGLTERVIQLIALITVLSLAPAILVMVTSFTRIVWCSHCCERRLVPPPRRPIRF